MKKTMRKPLMGIMFGSALLISAYAIVQFFILSPKGAGMVQLHLLDIDFPYEQWVNFLYIHAAGGAVALAVGPLLFSRRIQARRMKLHRRLGKLYVVSIAAGAASGFYLAFEAIGGVASHLGFLGLDLAWLITTWYGYRRIRQKRIEQHREWMIRSYALTFAGVTFRFWVATLGVLTIPLENFSQFELILDDYNRLYGVVAWLCWVPNLLFAEWLIRRRKKRNHQTEERLPQAA